MSDILKSHDVTEALIQATEKAGQMNATHVVVILYSAPPEKTDYKMSFVFNDDVTIETANWIIDKAKRFLLQEDPQE